jgi:hypothetical protein
MSSGFRPVAGRSTGTDADAGVFVTYALTAAWRLEAGYQLTYFFQDEKSHEDNNAFQLIDNAFRLGVGVRF